MKFCRPALRSAALAAACGLPLLQSGAQQRLPVVSITASRELSKDEQIAHVLSRLTFGARPGDAAKVAKMGVERWIERQLTPERIGDGDVNFAMQEIAVSRNTMSFSTMTPGLEVTTSLQARVMGTSPDAQPRQRISMPVPRAPIARERFPTDVAVAQKIVRAQLTDRQLLEVVTDFWGNHFSVYVAKMPAQNALAAWERDAIRPYALGKFRDLLGSVARSPAMMYYLDNYLSRAGGINENYARELLELHTLGADGGYSQQDVIEVARAFTGWSLDEWPNMPNAPGSARFRFVGNMHDTAAKTVLGHSLAPGRGMRDAEDVLDILARHPSTARYIAGKLVRRFVSDAAPETLIDRAAATFTATDGDIAAVVRTIVYSEEFFSRAAFRAKVRTPFEFLVATMRALDISTVARGLAARTLAEFGQPVYGRETPDGWPDYNEAWMNSGAILKRVFFSAELLEGNFDLMTPDRWDGWGRYGKKSVEEQADGVIAALLAGTASPETKVALLASSGEGLARLQEMVVTALGSPDFQRR